MRQFRAIPFESALWLAALLILLGETVGRKSLLRAHDKVAPRRRMTWCHETNTCSGCGTAKRPRCFGRGESLLGADLCGCCFSCLATRELGESCESQLSVRGEIDSADSMMILATSRCKEGLLCLKFVCREPEDNNVFFAESRQYRDEFLPVLTPNLQAARDEVVIGQSKLTTSRLHPSTPSANEEAEGRAFVVNITANVIRDPDYNLELPESTSVISVIQTPTKWPSKTLIIDTPNAVPEEQLLTTPTPEKEVRVKQPCQRKNNDPHTSDDLLGQSAVFVLKEKRFELIFSGNLLAELVLLLSVVDRWHEGSVLDEDTANSLVKGFTDFSHHPNFDRLSFNQDYFGDRVTSSELQNSGQSSELREVACSRRKRESVETSRNIQDILIRGATAHRDYTNEARFDVPIAASDQKGVTVPADEASSQGDESTVRVHITSGPRKIQTLVDLEEEEVREADDGGDHDSQSPRRGGFKNTGKLSPFADAGSDASSVFPTPSPSSTKATGMEIQRALDWSEGLLKFGDRLAGMEARVGVLERVLDEMVRWCNPGVPRTRECFIPQDTSFRMGQFGAAFREPQLRREGDEYVALGSGTDAVKLRGRFSPRRKNQDGEMRTTEGTGNPVARNRVRNFFRTIDSPKSRSSGATKRIQMLSRPRGSRIRGRYESAEDFCENQRRTQSRRPGNQRPAWSATIFDPTSQRIVQRQVRSTSTLRNSTPENIEVRSLETQIPRPRSQPENHEDKVAEDPGSTRSGKSFVETTTSSDTPSWRMFVARKDIALGQDSHRIMTLPLLENQRRQKADLDDDSDALETRFSLQRTNWSPSFVVKHHPQRTTLSKVLPSSTSAASSSEELPLQGSALRRFLSSTPRSPAYLKEYLAMRELDQPAVHSLSAKLPHLLGDVERLKRSVKRDGVTQDDHNEGPAGIRGRWSAKQFKRGWDELGFKASPYSKLISLFGNVEVPRKLERISGCPLHAQRVRDSRSAPYAITSHGNSTIRIEQINDTLYDEVILQTRGSSSSKDDFDYIYESVESRKNDYDGLEEVVYDQSEYIDGSSVEVVTAIPQELQGFERLEGRDEGPEEVVGLGQIGVSCKDATDEGTPAKHRLPLLWQFASIRKTASKTIA